jgi:hypothetical protein
MKNTNICTHFPQLCPKNLVESRWSLRGEEFACSLLGYTVRKREFEILFEELLDVWALDVFGLLDFDDLEDLVATYLERALDVLHNVNLRGWT